MYNDNGYHYHESAAGSKSSLSEKYLTITLSIVFSFLTFFLENLIYLCHNVYLKQTFFVHVFLVIKISPF